MKLSKCGGFKQCFLYLHVYISNFVEPDWSISVSSHQLAEVAMHETKEQHERHKTLTLSVFMRACVHMCVTISRTCENNERVSVRFLVYICGLKCERLSKQMRQRLLFTVNKDGAATHALCLHGTDGTIGWSLSLFPAGQVSLHRGVPP